MSPATKDIVEALHEAIETAREYVGRCDNSCLFERPGGMSTNGGCRCLDRREPRPGERPAIARVYRAAVDVDGVLPDLLAAIESAEEEMTATQGLLACFGSGENAPDKGCGCVTCEQARDNMRLLPRLRAALKRARGEP